MSTGLLGPLGPRGGSLSPLRGEQQQGFHRHLAEIGLDLDRGRLLRDEGTARGNQPPVEALIAVVPRLSLGQRQRLLDVLMRSFTPEDDLPLRVEKTPGVVGGSACIVRTRIPVWLLESYRRQGVTDAAILENFPTLRRADLQSAWSYASANREEIDHAIQANAEEA